MSLWAKQKGFTIVELLIVIVVIGILAAITIVAYNGVQARAKDSRRLNDMQVISGGLKLYYAQNGVYPTPSFNGPGGWESSSINPSQFLQVLKTQNIISSVPVDPVNTSTSIEYRYYRYAAGSYSCDATKGAYFVLGVVDMESSNGTYAGSPGWLCPGRDWQPEFGWVTGGFEN
jgi:prepilin-type N-terminal cleavage/methylation domain-containing protein